MSPTTSLGSAGALLEAQQGAFERKAAGVTAAALLATLGVCLGLWLWSRADEASAIRELPETERQALFHSTLDTLKGVCAPSQREDGLQRFCNEQARFILQFPECDTQCAARAKEAHALPAR